MTLTIRSIEVTIGCGINMKIVSWNINGLRAINKKGFQSWVKENDYDVICVQETKAHISDLKPSDYEIEGYTVVWHQGVKKGYSGVAAWIKNGISTNNSVGLGIEEFDNEGRTNIIEFDSFILYNGYFPNGREDHSRVEYKLRYSYAVLAWAKKQNKPVIICGDINTAHKEIDLKNPWQNINTTGFLLRERKFLDDLVLNKYFDVVRKFNARANYYSWWSYRGGHRENNNGWRIDYFWADERLEPRITNAYNDISKLGSDHCPVVIEITL